MKIKRFDRLLLQSQLTGELKMTSASEDWDGGRFLSTSQGTLDMMFRRHVDRIRKLSVLGVIVEVEPVDLNNFVSPTTQPGDPP